MAKTTKLPILVGSKVLSLSGFNLKPNDIDVIGFTGDFLDGKRVDTMTGQMAEYIYDICNSHYSNIVVIGGIEFILPPVELIYAMYKSHIHRILPVTVSQIKNYEVFMKKLRIYLDLRTKLGYKRMDKMIYGVSQEPKKGNFWKKKTESLLSFHVRNIFVIGFGEVNARVGDAHNTLKKPMDKFFKDNVKRFLEHDKLHELVAQSERKTTELLFERYKKKKTDTEMDQKLFAKALLKDRLQTIREEMIVLFLERYLLPTVQQTKKFPLEAQCRTKMMQCSLHFITNLCGDGHHWLRRFAIDHWDLYIIDQYSLENARDICEKVFGKDCIKEPDLKYIKVKELFNDLYENLFNVKKDEEDSDEEDSDEGVDDSDEGVDDSDEDDMEDVVFGKDTKFTFDVLRIINGNEYKCKFKVGSVSLTVEKILAKMKKMDMDHKPLLFMSDNCIVFVHSTIGLMWNDNTWTLFKFNEKCMISQSKGYINENEHYEPPSYATKQKIGFHDKYKINIQLYPLTSDDGKYDLTLTYKTEYTINYYSSNDCEHTMDQGYIKEDISLNYYGNAPHVLEEVFEYIANELIVYPFVGLDENDLDEICSPKLLESDPCR